MSYYPGQNSHHGQQQQQGYPPQQPGYPPQQYYSPPPPAQQYGQYPPPNQAPNQQPPYPYYSGAQQPAPQPGYPYGGPPPVQYQPQYQGQYPPPQAPYGQPPPAQAPYPAQQYQQQPPQQHQQPPAHYVQGKRKALLIGINYFGQKGQLRGCINDVKNMSAFLTERFGYKRDDMVILTDDQRATVSQPTKGNIIKAMHWLVKDARPGDSLFFHYSGHGGQTEDHDGDEGDGYDETIYPVDFRQAGHIVDDEMHSIMVKPLPAGCRLTAIFDSCHSGSALDLPYLYSTQGILKEPSLLKEAGEGLFDAFGSYSKGDVGGVLSAGMGILKRATTGKKAEERAKKTRTSPADVIQWSGSKDTQTSADTSEGGQATGAMSYAFISALKKNPQQTYQQLLQNIRQELQGKYSQKPQLSCCHPLGEDGLPLVESQAEFKI